MGSSQERNRRSCKPRRRGRSEARKRSGACPSREGPGCRRAGRRAEIPGKWRVAEGGGRRPDERAPRGGLGWLVGGPAATRPSFQS